MYKVTPRMIFVDGKLQPMRYPYSDWGWPVKNSERLFHGIDCNGLTLSIFPLYLTWKMYFTFIAHFPDSRWYSSLLFSVVRFHSCQFGTFSNKIMTGLKRRISNKCQQFFVVNMTTVNLHDILQLLENIWHEKQKEKRYIDSEITLLVMRGRGRHLFTPKKLLNLLTIYWVLLDCSWIINQLIKKY